MTRSIRTICTLVLNPNVLIFRGHDKQKKMQGISRTCYGRHIRKELSGVATDGATKEIPGTIASFSISFATRQSCTCVVPATILIHHAIIMQGFIGSREVKRQLFFSYLVYFGQGVLVEFFVSRTLTHIRPTIDALFMI